MVLVWQNGLGIGRHLGHRATRAINVEIPIIVFAFLFAFSMGYRSSSSAACARPTHDGLDPHAVVEASAAPAPWSPARRSSWAALVAIERRPRHRGEDFATALAAGILLDATLVRAILAPAAVILGRYNGGGSRTGRRGSSGSSPRAPGRRPLFRTPRLGVRALHALLLRRRPSKVNGHRPAWPCAAEQQLSGGRDVERLWVVRHLSIDEPRLAAVADAGAA